MASASVALDNRLTESGSDQARQGVSLAETMALMAQTIANLNARMDTLQSAPVAVPVQTATPARAANRQKANAKPAVTVAAKPIKPASTGEWYTDLLSRIDRKTGQPYYSVSPASIMVHGDVAIMRSTKWAPVLMLIKGRRKPVYLKPEALSSLIEASAVLESFVKKNQDYLVDHMSEDGEGEGVEQDRP